MKLKYITLYSITLSIIFGILCAAEQDPLMDEWVLIKKKGKIYIGTSAGSIIAGPRLPDYFSDEDADLQNTDGYGFVNFTLVPHWGSEDFKERYLGERLKAVYRDNQVPLLLLTDNQYVHVKDDQMQIVELG